MATATGKLSRRKRTLFHERGACATLSVGHVDVSYVKLEVPRHLTGPVAVLFQVEGMSTRNIGREEKGERWMTTMDVISRISG